jgi:Caspase domain/Sel1 repeat
MLKKCVVGLLSASITLLVSMPSALPAVSQSPDRLLVVDCLLPAKVRKLGGSMTYLAPRRAVKSIASECDLRGGEYVAYDRANFSTSLQVWKPQAEQGDPQAQVYVGEIFEKGLGTTPDLAQAAFWYQKAADQGYSRGLADLAYLYEKGLGVPKDPVKALNLYRQSAGISNDDLTFASEVSAAKSEAASQIEALTRQLAASNEQLESERNSLEQAKSQARDRNAALASAQREAQTLRARVADLKAAGGDTASADRAAELKRLQSQLAQNEAQIAQQQQDARALDAANAAKTAELTNRLQAATDEDRQLRAQLGDRGGDAQQARADLAAAKARMESMNAQIAELQRQLNAERSEVAGEKAKIAQQSSSRDAANGEELARLKLKLADRESRISQQQALISSVQTQRTSAEQQVERLKAQQAAAEQQQKQQVIDGEALKAQLASAQLKLLQAQQRLAEASASAADQKARITADQAQLQQRRDSASQAQQAEINRLSSALGDREAKLGEQRTRIAALEAESRSYSEEITRLKAQDAQTVALRSPNAGSVSTVTAPPPRVTPRELNLGGYYALIIGNNTYQNMPNLASAENDARALQRVLQEHYGFKTRLLINATRADILGALNEYRLSLGDKDNLLIYYAGHGELNERNLLGYWLPVNAKRDDTTEWISDRMITDQIGLMSARHILVIADSCYSGAMTRSSGLRLVAASGQTNEMKRLVKLATLPSRTVLTSGGVAPVLDGGAGANSIFARSLIDALAHNQSVLEGSGLYDQVFDPVRKAAARFKVDQSPRYSALSDAGHLNGEFLLIPVS